MNKEEHGMKNEKIMSKDLPATSQGMKEIYVTPAAEINLINDEDVMIIIASERGKYHDVWVF